MTITELVQQAHQNAVDKGFWDEYMELQAIARAGTIREGLYKYLNTACISQFIMLIASEVAEAQEALRYNNKDGFREELADIIIRVCDLADGLGIDLGTEIYKKMEKNKNRPYKHGKAF